jgi:hypothetical protein
MESKHQLAHTEALPGWVCVAIGVGFIALLIMAIILARMLGS